MVFKNKFFHDGYLTFDFMLNDDNSSAEVALWCDKDMSSYYYFSFELNEKIDSEFKNNIKFGLIKLKEDGDIDE